MVRNYAEGPTWVHAHITEQSGPVSYKVTVDATNQEWRRHQDAIHNYASENTPVDLNNSPPMDDFQFSPVLYSQQEDVS